MLELRAKARRLAASEGGKLGLVIVDYIQLMRAEDPRSNRVEQVGQFRRGLKILARELKVPVIGLSQLSRAPEQRPDKRPMLSDLRESGSIEQDADVVTFIYRDAIYNEDADRQRGRAHRRQAPQRADREGRRGLPRAVPALRRPRPRRRAAGRAARPVTGRPMDVAEEA